MKIGDGYATISANDHEAYYYRYVDEMRIFLEICVADKQDRNAIELVICGSRG